MAKALAGDKNRKQKCVCCTHSNIPAQTGNGIWKVWLYGKRDMSVDYWPPKWSVLDRPQRSAVDFQHPIPVWAGIKV